jgi:large subunit ribosomal protein L10
MLKADKERVVADLVERLRTSETLIVADYRGLTHKELDDVRGRLLESGARLSVVKNTLTRRAAEEAGSDALLELLTGPTAIAFVHDGDMVAVAKTLDETARSTRRLSLKGGVLDGKPIGPDAVKELASLPPAEVLRGQVLGAIVAPLTSLLGLVNAPLQGLVGLIDARIDQLGGEAAASATVEAPAAATAEDEPEPDASGEPAEEPAAEEQPEEPTDETPEDPANETTEEQE